MQYFNTTIQTFNSQMREDVSAAVEMIRAYLTVLLRERGSVSEQTRRDYHEIMLAEVDRLDRIVSGY